MPVQNEHAHTFARSAAPLLEREPELQRLRAAVDDARQGQGRLVLVEGHAGIGKTRLLEAAVEDADRLGVRVLHARGSELERDVPFGVAVQLLEPPVASASPTERELLLADAAGLAGPLLTGKGAPDARRAGHALHHGLFWVVSNLAERGALLIAVDDAQWADESSLRFLAYLAQRLDSLPVAVIAASQIVSEGFAAELLERLAADGRNDRVVPRPLTTEGVGAVVEARLGTQPEEGFVRACADATGGNPFLVSELSRVLAVEQIPPRANAAARVGLLATESIARSVLLRLGRLPDGATSLARATAVLGDGASLRHAAALAGLEPAAAGSAVDALAAAELLRPGEPLGFVHSIVRTSVYAELPRAERADHHGRAARLLADDGLPAERVAAQLLPGRPSGAPWAVETLRGAATRALARGTPRSAVRYLRRALAEPPEPEMRPAVLLALGEAEAATGDGRAVERFEEAAELADEGNDRASALEAAGRALHAAGRPRDAAEAFERAIAALNGSAEDNRELALRLEADWVTAARLDAGLRPRAVARLERLQSERTDPSTHAGRALVAHAAHERALAGAPRAEVRALARRALGEEDAAGVLTRRLALDALLWADELDEASLVVEVAVSDARRSGSIVAFATASRYRARVFHRLGRVTEALADTEAAAREPGADSRRTWPAAAPLLAHLLIERGELDRAGKALSSLTLATPEADALTMAELIAARGRLRLVQGRPRLAQQDFTDAGRRLAEVGIITPTVIAWRSGASLSAVRLGDRETAAALAAEELELARAADAPRATGLALRAAALAEADPVTRAEGLAEAAKVLEQAGDRLEHARTLGELGMLQREQGALTEARDGLRRGLDLASAAGAPALARGIREELVAAGAKPRRPSGESAATLTPSERRVAELAAQGLTNRQIAQALFVTVKTVEWHLRNAFVKLRITSRRELQPVLREAA